MHGKKRLSLLMVLALCLSMVFSVTFAYAEEAVDAQQDATVTAEAVEEPAVEAAAVAPAEEVVEEPAVIEEKAEPEAAVLLEEPEPEESKPEVSEPFNIANGRVTLSKTSFTYDITENDNYVVVGKIQKPTVTVLGVKDNKIITLKKGTDYTVTYENSYSRNAGTYKLTVKGTGDYTGTVTKSYTIKPKKITSDFWCYANDRVYTGSYIKPDKKYVKVSYNSGDVYKNLKYSTDYYVKSISYRNNKKIGYADITMTVVGKGNYTGTKTLYGSFTIGPKTVSIKSLKGYTGKFTVKWSRSSKADGYIIEFYSENGGMSRTRIVKGNTTLSKTIKAAKGTYYVNVFAYKNVEKWGSTQRVYVYKFFDKTVRVK